MNDLMRDKAFHNSAERDDTGHDGVLRIGKVPNQQLDELVLRRIKIHSNRVLRASGIGEDCGVLNFGNECALVTGDPVTGATKNAGTIAVQVACNDIAVTGVSPVAIHTTLLLPPGTTARELDALAEEIFSAADKLGVTVIGGHTEVTDAVTRAVISVTALGAVKQGEYVTAGGAKPGDSLVMTKTAGIEGTAILAAEFESVLRESLGDSLVEEMKKMCGNISVIAEGTLGGAFGVHAMHDVTEGGVFGAAWEMAEAAGTGVFVYRKRIPILDATTKLCEFFSLDPCRLISSGSMLLATDRPAELIEKMSGIGITAHEIGGFSSDSHKLEYVDDNTRIPLAQPGTDELYKAIKI